MEKKVSKIHDIHFEYYANDLMATNSIGKQKEWEPHITKFVKLFNEFYHIQNIVDIGANFGYHTIFFSKEVQSLSRILSNKYRRVFLILSTKSAIW